MNLRIEYCSYENAKYAVENWHYSKRMPVSKLIKFGVLEEDKFIGVVLYGSGANNNLLKPYDLESNQGCELVRVALRAHKVPVTKIIAITLRRLKQDFPGLRIVVSYADTRQGHVGKIYQAGNWYYTGTVKTTPDYYVNGKWRHQRSINNMFGGVKNLNPSTPRRSGGKRVRYVYPLDSKMRLKCEQIKKSYADIVQ